MNNRILTHFMFLQSSDASSSFDSSQVLPSAAKAATERSEGVAGAKRWHAPVNPP